MALDQKTWDVVISNFVVSQCTALEAIALLQEKIMTQYRNRKPFFSIPHFTYEKSVV